MDENKEILTSEQDAENTTNSDADTVSEELTAEITDEIRETPDANAEASDESDEISADAQPKKKKRLIQLPVIIAIVIVAVAVLTLLVYKGFFDKSVVGTWSTPLETQTDSATPDEASADEASQPLQYYVFDSNGKLSVKVGTIAYVYDYVTSVSDEGENLLTVSFNGSQSEFTYAVEGNMFTGKSLTLTSAYGSEIKLSNDSLKEPELKPSEDFKPNEKLTGEWSYDSGFSQMSYTFNEDGTVRINQMDIIIVDGVYSYTDNSIEITYYTDAESYMDLVYEIGDDSLVLNDIPYEKVTGETKETTQAQADASAAE